MGPGMMGRGDRVWGPGMVNGHYWQRGNGTPVKTLDQARQRAETFADPLNLRVGEVMQFSKNYYAELETPDGKLATEVLVNPSDGDTGIEYGPAMMWNTDYGMHHGGQTQTRISPDQAQDRAQKWLRDRGSDLTAGETEAPPRLLHPAHATLGEDQRHAVGQRLHRRRVGPHLARHLRRHQRALTPRRP
ncbi:hypothetical protein ABZ946_01410 [Streptomyces sp. NPDC046324]|uniref:hypothetical protein n=1 Tax=Streptomyces sp. NPDC046324 TaxID=3154915 RepID=UPI0033D7719C